MADSRAFSAPLILVQRGCRVHGRCWSAQLNRAVQSGYRIVHDQDGWLALRKPAP